MFGPNVGGGGLGRYVEQLVKELQSIDHKNRFVLFLKPENFKDCEILNKNFEKRKVDIHWYTLKEQISFSKIIEKEKLDLIHFPHWNVPLNLKTPFVVTIHDLILLEQPLSAKATTKNFFVYRIKYAAYKFVLRNALRKSQKIVAISSFTKTSILKWFPSINKEKVQVVFDGITDLAKTSLPPKQKDEIGDSFILSVGNAYPHKNLERLLKAFRELSKKHKKTKLVLAGKETIFYKRLLKNKPDNVIFIDSPEDQELKWLYENASLYAFPSLIEGFGLPALEAMASKLPVIASNNSSLPEILESAAEYFDPKSEKGIQRAMEKVLENKPLQKQLTESGLKQAAKYSWTKMAKDIKHIYETCGKKESNN